jgi:hypothetical protein
MKNIAEELEDQLQSFELERCIFLEVTCYNNLILPKTC